MKKKICIFMLLILSLHMYAGRKDCPALFLYNQSGLDFFILSEINGKPLKPIGYNSIFVDNEEYNLCLWLDEFILSKEYYCEKNSYLKIGELPFNSNRYETYGYFYKYFLLFSKNGSLINRIDDITNSILSEDRLTYKLTVTETAPIDSVPLNYPSIPESYQTDSYYIKNNTDELVYVVAPDYIGVPHPEAGILEEGESFFIPSKQVTNGLSFYRELYPGESFYLGKAAHPVGQKYIQNASEGFNEYLPLIYLVTPEMNVLYRLENFENYEFTETSNTDGKKIVLELQEEMSMRHTDMWTKYKLDF